MERNFIKIGESYGNIKVLSMVENRPRKYLCQCLRCGAEFIQYSGEVNKNAEIGCIKCREIHHRTVRLKKFQQYVGKETEDFRIEGVRIGFLYKNQKREMAIAKCYCKKCSSVTEIPLARVISGQTKMCKFCNKKYLEIGRMNINHNFVDGTCISSIDGHRAMNKNNSSGYNGVSFNRHTKKWRAYINFRRKQYGLGEYANLEDAVKARQAAEERIYGNFLKWYAEEYPAAWEKRKKMQGD